MRWPGLSSKKKKAREALALAKICSRCIAIILGFPGRP